MSHGVHDGPAGMVLFDGCAECKERAADPLHALLHMDQHNALKMWRLMRAERWSGGEGAGREVSECEGIVLEATYRIAVYLERNVGLKPETIEAAMEARL